VYFAISGFLVRVKLLRLGGRFPPDHPSSGPASLCRKTTVLSAASTAAIELSQSMMVVSADSMRSPLRRSIGLTTLLVDQSGFRKMQAVVLSRHQP